MQSAELSQLTNSSLSVLNKQVPKYEKIQTKTNTRKHLNFYEQSLLKKTF